MRKPGYRVLDLGSGSGEMLGSWARDHGIIGTGIDPRQLFQLCLADQAQALAPTSRVKTAPPTRRQAL